MYIFHYRLRWFWLAMWDHGYFGSIDILLHSSDDSFMLLAFIIGVVLRYLVESSVWDSNYSSLTFASGCKSLFYRRRVLLLPYYRRLELFPVSRVDFLKLNYDDTLEALEVSLVSNLSGCELVTSSLFLGDNLHDLLELITGSLFSSYGKSNSTCHYPPLFLVPWAVKLEQRVSIGQFAPRAVFLEDLQARL